MERYEVDGFVVTFTPWHSEYLDEDFVGVSITRDGREVFHSGMTKTVPSEEQARELVDALTAIEAAIELEGSR